MCYLKISSLEQSKIIFPSDIKSNLNKMIFLSLIQGIKFVILVVLIPPIFV